MTKPNTFYRQIAPLLCAPKILNVKRLLRAPMLLGMGILIACGGDRDSASTNTETSPQSELEQAIAAGQPQTEQVVPRTYVYRCDNNFRFAVNIGRDSALLLLPDQRIQIPLVISASGARYSDGTVTYWSKGDRAQLEVGKQSYSGCKIAQAEGVWADAKLRGVDFRGVGQEPGWYVEIDDGKQVLFVGDYGELRVTTPAPAPTVTAQSSARGALTTYNIQTDAHRMAIEIEDKPCRDAMSGEPFPATVNMTVDGKSYRGCGRSLR